VPFAPGAILYFSSRRFVQWASVETIAGYLAKIFATSGEGCKDVVTSVINQLMLEFNDLYGWLKNTAQQNADAIVDAFIDAIVTLRGYPESFLGFHDFQAAVR